MELLLLIALLNGAASGKTDSTTATVEVNSPEANQHNSGRQLKIKFK